MWVKIQKEGEVRQESWATTVHERGVEERKVSVRSEEQEQWCWARRTNPAAPKMTTKLRQEAVIIHFSSQPLPRHI